MTDSTFKYAVLCAVSVVWLTIIAFGLAILGEVQRADRDAVKNIATVNHRLMEMRGQPVTSEYAGDE